MSLITVVTPTYNRAFFLPFLFDSLCKQICKDFEWLIVDDGSTDNTKEIVQSFNADFKVRYLWKENGGKHSALNLAFEEVSTDLFFIVDSDDLLLPESIETIKRDWEIASKINVDRKVCGIGYLRGYTKDKVIGNSYTRDYVVGNFIEERYNKGTDGDKAEVWVTSCLKGFKFMEYDGEKFISESVAWIWLAERYDMLFVNKIIYITKYMKGGLSDKGRRLRFLCPHLMAYGSMVSMSSSFSWRIRIKETLLYIVYCLFGKLGWSKIFNCKYKKLVVLCAFPGWLLYRIWKKKYNL